MLNGVQISEEREEPFRKDTSLSLGRLHLWAWHQLSLPAQTILADLDSFLSLSLFCTQAFFKAKYETKCGRMADVQMWLKEQRLTGQLWLKSSLQRAVAPFLICGAESHPKTGPTHSSFFLSLLLLLPPFQLGFISKATRHVLQNFPRVHLRPFGFVPAEGFPPSAPLLHLHERKPELFDVSRSLSLTCSVALWWVSRLRHVCRTCIRMCEDFYWGPQEHNKHFKGSFCDLLSPISAWRRKV